jgi:hypothetical protein
MSEDYVGACDGGPWAGNALASTRRRAFVESASTSHYYEWSEARGRWVWIDEEGIQRWLDDVHKSYASVK